MPFLKTTHARAYKVKTTGACLAATGFACRCGRATTTFAATESRACGRATSCAFCLETGAALAEALAREPEAVAQRASQPRAARAARMARADGAGGGTEAWAPQRWRCSSSKAKPRPELPCLPQRFWSRALPRALKRRLPRTRAPARQSTPLFLSRAQRQARLLSGRARWTGRFWRRTCCPTASQCPARARAR